MVRKLTPILSLLQRALVNLRENDPIRMAGATAFFTFFALPPIVIILGNVLSAVFDDGYQRVSSQLFDNLAELFGHKSASELESISHNLQRQKPNLLLTALGFVLLFVASTTLFAVLKNSINQLWNIKARPERKVLYVLTDKAIALVIILASGLLFTVSVTLEKFATRLGTNLSLTSLSYYPQAIGASNLLGSILIRMVWFALLFKYLPDVRIRWKAVWLGGLVTSVLFKIGEEILNRLLINSPVSSLYGASGALILTLLFVFYSALIFYYGASFTRQCSEWMHMDVTPGPNAVAYTITEVDPADQPNEPTPGR